MRTSGIFKNLWRGWWVHASFTILKLLVLAGLILALVGIIVPNAAKNFGG